jgi:phage terminase small subunit
MKTRENQRKPEIQAKIEELRQLQQERTQVTADRVVEKLWKIANFDIRSVCSFDGNEWQFKPLEDWDESALATMTIVGTDNRGRPKIRAESKVAALESLAKHLGMYVDFNVALVSLRKYGLALKQDEPGVWSIEDMNV